MTANHRPLSPHLQVYRLPLTGMISIAHRIAGVFLVLGLPLFAFVLYAIASGEVAYLSMQGTMAFWASKLIYWGVIYALFFHLCHGLRHLIWDAGKGFARATLTRYAVFELLASLALTAATLAMS